MFTKINQKEKVHHHTGRREVVILSQWLKHTLEQKFVYPEHFLSEQQI